MAEMGEGYGSECHLLRYLGRHRQLRDRFVLQATGAERITWLDFHFDPAKSWQDRERTGLDFLAANAPVVAKWPKFWPVQGNPPNWDAVSTLRKGGAEEWLLCEAKANLQELQTACSAKEEGGRPQIREAMDATKRQLGVDQGRDWLAPYYQYCNRLANLNFLNAEGIPARLLYIYFIKDKGDARRTCPQSAEEWVPELERMEEHVGLPAGHHVKGRIHKLFIDVCPS